MLLHLELRLCTGNVGFRLLGYFLSCLSDVRRVSVPWLLVGEVQLVARPHFLDLGEIQCQEFLQQWSFYLYPVGLPKTLQVAQTF